MPFTLIKGTFHVRGYSPDGDSLKFKATRNNLWDKLDGKTVQPNSRSHVQLRVEGIDSLETHYSRDPTSHQPLELAHIAGDELMDFLGITGVTWGPTHSRVAAANDGTRGYILARRTGPYGRPICFVFPGSTGLKDGSPVYLDSELLSESLNYHMLAIGHAYPLFYETLFFDLRNTLAAAVTAARDSGLGFWPEDETETWVSGTNVRALENQTPIFPKTFRRLVDHRRSGEPFSLFRDKLASERITIVPTVHHTGFDWVIETQDRRIRMTANPEDLVFRTVLV